MDPAVGENGALARLAMAELLAENSVEAVAAAAVAAGDAESRHSRQLKKPCFGSSTAPVAHALAGKTLRRKTGRPGLPTSQIVAEAAVSAVAVDWESLAQEEGHEVAAMTVSHTPPVVPWHSSSSVRHWRQM